MSPARTVALIAEREVRQKLRAKLFVGSTLGLALLLSLLALAPTLLGWFTPDEPDPAEDLEPVALDVGVIGALADEERTALEGAFGEIEFTDVDDEQDAEVMLGDGEVAFVVVPGERILIVPPSGLFGFQPPTANRAAETLGLLEVLDADPDRVGEVLDAPALPVEALGAEDQAGEAGRLIAANIGVVFLFGVLIMYASMIINGVIEEKGSRVVELLVEAVPVRQLMAGKVLGLGLVGLGQTLIIFGPPVAVLLVTAGEFVPPGTTSLLGALLLWFMLGYGLYAVIAAGLGSLVSRPEEAQAVLTPANVLMILGYFIGFAVINAPDATFARIAAIVPFTAPYAMLVRQAVGEPLWWELALAIGLSLVAIAGLTLLAARLYEGGILRVGARVRVRDAWRSAQR